MRKIKFIIGIDEVGRGSLAGPVTVCAFLALSGEKLINRKLGKIHDSKKLSEKQREIWSTYLKNKKDCRFAIASLSPKQIDKVNISKSANLCAQKALAKLEKRVGIKNLQVKSKIYLDGGLYVGNKKSGIGTTIIKGDEKIQVISAASILAKVHRDKIMKRYATKFANYGFESNKGYGTPKHIKALKRFGPTEIHRKTYTKNFI